MEYNAYLIFHFINNFCVITYESLLIFSIMFTYNIIMKKIVLHCSHSFSYKLQYVQNMRFML